MSAKVCFLDTETTGLDPDRHEIWEVGLIDADDKEHVWELPVDLGKADRVALDIGKYYERSVTAYPRKPQYIDGAEYITKLNIFAYTFEEYTRDCHLAGNVVSFDEERLRKLLRANGACPGWHYHLIDVENLAAGLLQLRPPYNSFDLSRAVGVEPHDFDTHTALGDARWAKAMYNAVLNWNNAAI